MTNRTAAIAELVEKRGAAIELWWRDDDAGHPHPMLETILEASARLDTDIVMAVVPAWLTQSVRKTLEAAERCVVAQHGWAHRDRSPTEHKKIELGGGACPEVICAELFAGHRRLSHAFGNRFIPMLVPPWNRIEDEVCQRLERCDYGYLSTYRAHRGDVASGIIQLNTHIDVICWQDNARFIGIDDLLRELADSAERWPSQPIGLLTHHQVMEHRVITELVDVLARLREDGLIAWSQKFADIRSL